jgi:hypothetical protein
MTPMQALLVFVGIPLVFYAVVWLLVSVPSAARRPKYRPGVEWDAGPEWFNLDAPARDTVDAVEPTADSGGASARW